MKNFKIYILAACSMLFITCKENSVTEDQLSAENQKLELRSKDARLMSLGAEPRALANLNGRHVVLYKAEYLSSGEGEEIGREVYFNNRGNKQLSDDFVPGLSLDGSNNISYYVDNKRACADLPASTTENAIDRAMATWNGVDCSSLGMTKIPFNSTVSTGFVAALLGYPGSLNYTADLVHAGWLPGAFFDQLAPGGSNFILGVTFTIIFTDELGNPVDTDNNNKADVAFREIYYNDAFTWRDGGTYDVETVALHESGHGLSQAHFGSAFRSANNKLHFSPRAVMNAAYSGTQTKIEKTDLGGHCSNWASWPNR
ncbi:hypothetical protein [Daejeonella oryzae]|uniref:hypothetical protein n=1 Tax=Daejeonella oryzae TaxID=1122943 RepID=UPI00041DAFB6|nr:hypothetical protein [Daejeonella oryzae]